MISEHKFVSAYTSFWRLVLPFGDSFTRRMNLGSEIFNRRPYNLTVSPDRASLVSEMSFRFLVLRLNSSLSDQFELGTYGDVAQAAWRYVCRFPDSGLIAE